MSAHLSKIGPNLNFEDQKNDRWGNNLQGLRTFLTTLDMVQVQINTGLSNKKMQELAVTLNKTTIQKFSKQNLGKTLQWLVEKLKVYSKFPKSLLQGHQQKLINWQRLFTARVYGILLTQFSELEQSLQWH